MSQRYVRIDGGIVVEVVDISGREVPILIGDGDNTTVRHVPATIDDLFHPNFVATLRLSEAADIGWIIDGGELVAPPPTEQGEEPATA